MPIWSEAFDVAPQPAGLVLIPYGPISIPHTLFFAVQGIVFGFILGTAQSVVTSNGWRQRVVWITVSVVSAASGFGLMSIMHALIVPSVPIGYVGADWNMLGVMSLLSPLAWAFYAIATGVAMHRLIRHGQRTQQDSWAARFD